MMVRTRFAPSPTGFIHIGNVRTALYAFLFAKKNNGKFILRIEDTDQERFVPGAIEKIILSLRLAGIQYDEGPYIQSERKSLYEEYAKKLILLGGAYESKEPKGTVIRQKVPKEGATSFFDEVYGKIEVENKDIEEGVLLKSDGLPTYNFANVVDDHFMKISHIVRGSEFLSSTPKHVLLYEAFDWEKPVFIHLPPIMRDTRKKLSKRDGDATFEDFLARGYLPEAIVNYVVLLGWHPKTEQEIFSLEELEKEFSLEGLSKSPAIFDFKKLDWMNAEYIRAMSLERFHEYVQPYYKEALGNSAIDFLELSKLLHARTIKFSDIPAEIDFFNTLPEYSSELFVKEKIKSTSESSLDALQKSKAILESISDWNESEIRTVFESLIQNMGVKNGVVYWPLRIALSGREFTPGGAIEIAAILGKEETLRRIENGIQKLS